MSARDFFVSYKSGDVAFCRRLVERLRAHGYQTWFNEYDVHSDQQPEFQYLINKGIDAAQWGILVLGAGYTDSAYCNVEVERLLRRLPPERLVPITVDGFDDKPDEAARFARMYPEVMARAVPVGNDEGVLYRRLHELGALSEPLTAVRPEALERHRWSAREAGFSFDNSIWAVEVGSLFREQVWHDVLSYSGQRRTEYHTFYATEEIEAKLLLDYERLDGSQAEAIRTRMQSPAEKAEEDDRRRLKEELTYFQQEAGLIAAVADRTIDPLEGEKTSLAGYRKAGAVSSHAVEEIGVHMYSLAVAGTDIKQRLFSFRLPALDAIFRVYKISFLHPLFEQSPFVVRIAFRFPNDLQAFYRGLPWCDCLVNSFLLTEKTSQNDEEFEKTRSKAASLFRR